MQRGVILLVALVGCSGKKPPAKDDAAVARDARHIDAVVVNEARQIDAAVEPRALTLDVRGLSRACAADTDCVLVDVRPCSRCSCKDTPIAKSALPAIDAQSRGACERTDAVTMSFTPCIECEGMAGACVSGQCEVKTTAPARPDAECVTDADCVVSCEKRGECCPPVTCEDVVPRAKALEIATFNRDQCDHEKRARCPAQRPHDYLTPKCRNGSCYGKYE